MLWYGSSNINVLYKLFNINLKKNLNEKRKKVCLDLTTTLNLNRSLTFFYIPHNWKVTIFLKKQNSLSKLNKNYYLYIYSPCYYFFLSLPNNVISLIYDSALNSFYYRINAKKFMHCLFWKRFLNLFYSFSLFFFRKLRVRGKGYYIFKNFRNTIALQFGYSHKIYVYSYFLFVKFLNKTTLLFFGINKMDLTFNSFSLLRTRQQNIFTGKGVRFTRQIVYKKASKLSS